MNYTRARITATVCWAQHNKMLKLYAYYICRIFVVRWELVICQLCHLNTSMTDVLG